jgi:hypothetical protein
MVVHIDWYHNIVWLFTENTGLSAAYSHAFPISGRLIRKNPIRREITARLSEFRFRVQIPLPRTNPQPNRQSPQNSQPK